MAAPGDLDTTFGGGKGWVSTGFQRSIAATRANALIRQADGKLVAAGTLYNGFDHDFVLVRYKTDGSLDTAFDADGKVVTRLDETSEDDAHGLIQQADGKLVVVGSSTSDSSTQRDFALVRYSSDGSLDTGFGNAGKVITDISGLEDGAYSVVQQADGKLVAAGFTNTSGNYYLALARYNPDGSLDTAFDGDGKLVTDVGAMYSLESPLARQADGKLVVATSSYNAGNYDIMVVRYNSDGTLDTSFDGDGKRAASVSTSYDYARAIIQQGDGKLVVAGSSYMGANYDLALVRFNSDGSLDTSFDGDGKLSTPVGTGDDDGYALVQQSNGQLVVSGSSRKASGELDVALVRYNANGSLDTAFDGDGKLTTDISPSYGDGYSVIQQPDGQLVVAGAADNDMALVRYGSTGVMDTGFDADGVVTTRFFFSSDTARAMVQQSDGKLVVVGYSNDANNSDYTDISVLRYNQDGSLDTGFDGDGKLVTAIGSTADDGHAVLQQTDGKLVIAGDSWDDHNAYSSFAAVRYNSDGSLDSSFDSDGKLTTRVGASDGVNAMLQQADGKLVLAGYTSSATFEQDIALVRYNTDGSLDTSFDGDGRVVTSAALNGPEGAHAVIQQADGKLVIAGVTYSEVLDQTVYVLVRYNSNGSLDSSFDGDGKVTTQVGSGTALAYGLTLQSDGKLVVTGSAWNGSNDDITVVRYNSNGSLDTGFGVGGKVYTDIDTGYDTGFSVIQSSDGKLVVAGEGYGADAQKILIAVLRYNAAGELDTEFSGDGKLLVDVGVRNGTARSVIQQADGKLAVASSVQGVSTGTEFVVVRLESTLVLDTDGDGVPDSTDAFPANPAEWLDADHDGTGNNADWDDDGDAVPDAVDSQPLNPAVKSEIRLPLQGSYRGAVVRETNQRH